MSPPKPKLNRKKYIEETEEQYNTLEETYLINTIYLLRAAELMMAHTDNKFKLSLEAVGAAKVVRLAIRLKEFEDKLKAEGRTEYKLSEKLEYIRDVLEA